MRKAVLVGLYTLIVLVALLPFLRLDIVEAAYPTTEYRGLSWYGFDESGFDTYWKITQANYDVMVSRYPNMTVFVLPFSYWAYGYTDRLNRLKEWVGWCEADGIKVVISNYGETHAKSSIITYWENMATLFDGNTTILGFDLINEPWGLQNNGWVLDWGAADAFTWGLPVLITAILALICGVLTLKRMKGKSWEWAVVGLFLAGAGSVYFAWLKYISGF